jgi:hypothetical protein
MSEADRIKQLAGINVRPFAAATTRAMDAPAGSR